MPVANSDDCIGYGFSAQQAELIGAPVSKLNGAAATLQTGAAVILSNNTELNAALVTTNSFVFPSTAKIMNPYFLTSTGAQSAFVFVPSGHTIAGTANGSVSIAANTAAIVWQYKSKNWISK